MGFPLSAVKHIAFVVLAILITLAIAQEDPLAAEKDALLALRANFNDPILNANWTGDHCYPNDSPRWSGIRCVNGRVAGIVLEGLGLIGGLSVNAFLNFEELSLLSFKNNSLKGNMIDLSNNSQMKYIDLSGNEFDGPISKSLLNLNLLETLFLQDNKLTGEIPGFNQSSLKAFNVSNNDLDGKIPKTQTLQRFGPESYSGNPRLILASVKDSDSSDQKKQNSTMYLIFNVILVFVVIVLLMLYCNTTRKLSKMMKLAQIPTVKDVENAEEKVPIAEQVQSLTPIEERKELTFFKDRPKFQMGELLKASAEALGQGTMGNSYKATLHGGPTIIVKRLRDLKPLTIEEFARVLHQIADLSHPNLLPLLAYYHSKDEKLLLYKYVENGNLFFRLHGSRNETGNRVPFKWNSRLSVARGVARALEYLHLNTKSQTIVPHGNLKSSNVFLDENDNVLVSDYALSSLIAQPIAAQRMVAYKSPEYSHARRVTRQSDVWSYGCFLIELLTGKLSISSAPPGVNGVDLCGWVNRAVREEWTAEIFDREIFGHKNDHAGMLRLLQIAMQCIERFPEKRPEMREVVKEVEKIEVPPLMAEDEEYVSGRCH